LAFHYQFIDTAPVEEEIQDDTEKAIKEELILCYVI